MQVFRIILTLILFAVISPAAWSADAFWEATLSQPKKGNIVVKLNDVTSVALHTYMLNGVQEITECTIDTKGNNSIRFFALMGGDNKDATMVHTALGSSQVPGASSIAASYPARKFPEGSYSHNIEYQLKSAESVYKVFQSIKDAWRKSTSTTVKNIE